VHELLPSAFYDLSRRLPSAVAVGYTDPNNSRHYQLSPEDLVRFLRGREAASRFLSTFIVNELEGRRPAELCTNRNQQDSSRKRKCRGAFELITFELLRDVNGVVCGRTSDPLFALMEGLTLQRPGSDGGPEVDGENPFRACDVCRLDFATAVHNAREELWHRLPEWFCVDVPHWGSPSP